LKLYLNRVINHVK